MASWPARMSAARSTSRCCPAPCHQAIRLQLNDLFNAPITTGALPESLLELEFSYNWDDMLVPGVFPVNLRRLVLREMYWTEQALCPGVLPSSLRFLRLGSLTKLRVGSLPEGLQGLYLPDGTASSFSPGVLPSTLSHIRSGGEIRFEEGDFLPSGLLYLVCLATEHVIRASVLPLSLRAVSLCFGVGECDPKLLLTPGVIPQGVELVELVGYDQPLAPSVLPSTVIFVRLLSGDKKPPLVRGAYPKACSG